MDQNALQQIIDRLKEANNVLVTVSTNPSVDQLAACIGFTLLLNHLGKHGTAVFSGAIPSTIEFLKPDDTLEKNTDSLRDFIIALDKSKADKLRYKVEDTVVKIFITPYRTSISEKDLDFSQGDFNVDAVIALGVHERTDLDKAIMDHGRILHDATVISVNNKDQGNLGAINWVDLNASSLSEMLVELAHGVTKDPLDSQMATAFMTGIVAETDRFSNTKTSPRTMALASELMSAGANQQLIASKLDAVKDMPQVAEKITPPEETKKAAAKESADGSLQIAHDDSRDKEENDKEEAELPSMADEAEPDKEEAAPEPPKIESKATSDNDVADVFSGLSNPAPKPVPEPDLASLPSLTDTPPANPEPAAGMPNRASMALDPPSMGGHLTANSVPESMQVDASTDPLSLPSIDAAGASPPLLNRSTETPPMPGNPPAATPEPTENLEDARDAVSQAIASDTSPQALEPIEALGAQPVNLDLRDDAPSAPVPEQVSASTNPGLIDNVPIQPVSSTDDSLPSPPQPTSAAPSSPPADAPLPPLPYTPAPDPTSGPAPFDSPALTPMPQPTSTPPPPLQPFGAPPEMNGVNPNVPTSLLPPSQPVDPTASAGSPGAPPPVPPPLLPPTDAI